MKRKSNPFQNKKFIGTTSLYQLPITRGKKEKEIIITPLGKTITTSLTQTHFDILQAIAIIYDKKNTNGELSFVFSPYKVLKFLGHEKKTNHEWLINKLNEIKKTDITINSKRKIKNEKVEINLSANIIDTIVVKKSGELKTPTKVFILFTQGFYRFILQDIRIFMKQEMVKAIIYLKHDFLKAIARYCLAHKTRNLTFENLLRDTGYQNVAKSLKSRIRKELLNHKDYFLKNFSIEIRKEGKKIIIYYNQNNSVAFDYTYLSNNEIQEKIQNLQKNEL